MPGNDVTQYLNDYPNIIKSVVTLHQVKDFKKHMTTVRHVFFIYLLGQCQNIYVVFRIECIAIILPEHLILANFSSVIPSVIIEISIYNNKIGIVFKYTIIIKLANLATGPVSYKSHGSSEVPVYAFFWQPYFICSIIIVQSLKQRT